LPESDALPHVITLGPIAPEPLAYALARYSRSPDSIRDSLAWVRAHDSSKFLDSFYFQYGHASIADLGHLALCFEGISEIAAIEIEDEPLWDGQARSSRYQDFSKAGLVTPPELTAGEAGLYRAAGANLLAAYRGMHAKCVEALKSRLPRPGAMKPEAYERNIAARAFDIARYLLILGAPTGVGQVTSIRTLERQIRRMKASEYAEIRALGEEAAAACTRLPECLWREEEPAAPVAPTLAKYVSADPYPGIARQEVAQWAAENLPPKRTEEAARVELTRPEEPAADIAATLLYSVTDRSYRELYSLAAGWSSAMRMEVLDAALKSRSRHDDLLREFRGGPYVYDFFLDIGAYRDLHRHRRCTQVRQRFSWGNGFELPQPAAEFSLAVEMSAALEAARSAAARLPSPASHYLLPFASRCRFLMKMDFAEAEYISRLRSGVKGHFSYRDAAWRMKTEMERLEPDLGRLIEATPPEIEDPLIR
jgi:thymidylate synthase ThyX